VNFTIDLNSSTYIGLSAAGGYAYSNGVIIARINDYTDGFIAVAQTCTHNGCTISYGAGSETFICPCHGGTYDLNGNVIAGPPPYAIKKYTVTRNGNILTIAG
jgi:cytochrome b6-f complex iron-sulfur subunit